MPKQYYVNLTHRGETYTRERDPNLSFEELCDDVWTGQLEDFVSIIEVDLEAGTARDCEKDVALALSHRSFRDGEPHYEVVDLIEKYGFECFKNERPRAQIADYRDDVIAVAAHDRRIFDRDDRMTGDM